LGELNTDSTYSINLKAGWNLIGNPFITSITWDDTHVQFSVDGTTFITLSAATASGLIRDVRTYSNMMYLSVISGAALTPGNGFWIKVSSPSTIKFNR
ncbi:MAG: hypothetical protein AB1546_13925, partial [bacterium]